MPFCPIWEPVWSQLRNGQRPRGTRVYVCVRNSVSLFCLGGPLGVGISHGPGLCLVSLCFPPHTASLRDLCQTLGSPCFLADAPLISVPSPELGPVIQVPAGAPHCKSHGQPRLALLPKPVPVPVLPPRLGPRPSRGRLNPPVVPLSLHLPSRSKAHGVASCLRPVPLVWVAPY